VHAPRRAERRQVAVGPSPVDHRRRVLQRPRRAVGVPERHLPKQTCAGISLNGGQLLSAGGGARRIGDGRGVQNRSPWSGRCACRR
ncbi:Os03g0245901, partial [Oryza sativa Japonica Group]